MKRIHVLLIVFIIACVVLLLMKRRENFESGIPKIIHQTAPSDESKWKSQWKMCQNSWKDLHKDFEYRFWSDEDIDTYMKKNYPDFYENVFTKYDVHIKRVDAVRYFILKDFGGIYADMDYMCQKRFFEELEGTNVYIAESPWAKGTHQNALMISPKGHAFWDDVIEEMKKRKEISNPIEATGPSALDECISKYKGGDLITLNKEEFSPMLPNQEIKDFPNAKAFHLGTCSWC